MRNRNVPVEPAQRLFETPKKFGPESTPLRIHGTVPGEQRTLDREFVEQVILEESTLLGVASRLRPDIGFEEGAYVYGWEIREVECQGGEGEEDEEYDEEEEQE
jgi:hypothetical protein